MGAGGSEPVTLINTFTVAPEDQAQLVALLSHVTHERIVTASGFLGATLHRSLDGLKVTMVARWRSAEDYAAMRQTDQSRATLDAISAIATFAPAMYAVVEVFTPRA